MASFKGVIDKDGRHYSLIPLVECKEALEYTIPSFSVITVDVRRVRYQVILEGGSAAIVDGFIKDIEELNTRIFPTRIAVELSSNNACLVQVDELEKSVIDTTTLSLMENRALFLWKWTWVDGEIESESEDDIERTDITIIPETPPELSDEDDADKLIDTTNDVNVVHTVTFKCIGCTRDVKYQKTLENINELRRANGMELDNVECRIMPEPQNPFDARAIAFQCYINSKWQTIGYVVKEALDDVHLASQQKCILGVKLEWVKYIIYWQTPAWYAGVSMTKRGEWSKIVLTSQSAKI